MKRFLKIFAVVFLLVIAVMVILPFAFKGKIVRLIKSEINKSVNAKVDFSGASLSLFKSFPDFSLTLRDFSVTGNDAFEKDTLLIINKMQLTLDVFSVFRGNPYEVKRISLNKPSIRLLVLENGSYNWDIMLPEPELSEADAIEEAGAEPMVLKLKEMTIRDGLVIYDDKEMDFILTLTGLDGTTHGNLSETVSTFNSQATATSLKMVYEKVAYMSGVKVKYDGLFEVDLEQDYYTMKDNRVWLNDLAVDVTGGVGFVGDDITMNIQFKSKDNHFKNLLSLVPAVYAKDFDKVQAVGEFALSGFIDGLYGDTAMPGFGLDLTVNRAQFSYPDLPESVDDINILAAIKNASGDPDATLVDIERFNFNIARNPVAITFRLKTPVSDPDMDAAFKGKFDFSKLAQVIPLSPDETLQGLVQFDARFVGRLSDIENQRFNQVTADGNMAITDLVYNSADIKLPISVHSANISFSPAFMNLANLDLTLGQSRIDSKGRVENYLAYFLGKGYLKANLDLQADLLDINEMLAATSSGDAVPADTVAHEMQLPDLPERMDLTLNANAKKILYSKYELNNAVAIITYKDQVITFNPMTAQLLKGTVEMKGSFDTSPKTTALVDLDFRIKSIDIPLAYKAIDMLQLIAPIAERAKGTLTTGFNVKGKLDHAFNPLYESLQGSGKLQTSQMSIEPGKVMEQLATLLGNDGYKRLVTDGLNLAFEFVNGKMFLKPTDFQWADSKTTMGGFVGFDQQMVFDLIFQIPYEKFGSGVNQTLAKLVSEAGKKGVNISPGSNLVVNAKLTGSVLSPRIELDYKAAAANLRTEIENIANQAIQEQKEEIIKKVSAEAEKILNQAKQKGDELIAQAENTATRLRNEATTTAQKLRTEADNTAKKTESEGKKKGLLAEMAAKETAKLIRSEAENSATKLIQEADTQAEGLIQQARNQANELLLKAQEQVDRLQ